MIFKAARAAIGAARYVHGRFMHGYNEARPSTAVVTRRNAEGEVIEAKIDDGRIAIIARRDDFAKWSALYGEKGGERIELPSCFSLNDNAIATLEGAARREQ